MLPEEFTVDFLKNWMNKGHILDNALYSLGKSQYNNDDPNFTNMKRKLNYLNIILKTFGFSNILDFDKKVVASDAVLQKMKNTKLVEWATYKTVMEEFDKRIRCPTPTNEFSLQKYIIISNCIINEFGIKLTSKRNQIGKRGNCTYIYTYKLDENIPDFRFIINKFV